MLGELRRDGGAIFPIFNDTVGYLRKELLFFAYKHPSTARKITQFIHPESFRDRSFRLYLNISKRSDSDSYIELTLIQNKKYVSDNYCVYRK